MLPRAMWTRIKRARAKIEAAPPDFRSWPAVPLRAPSEGVAPEPAPLDRWSGRPQRVSMSKAAR